MALSNATVSKNVLIGVVVFLILIVLAELAWGAMTLSQKPSPTTSPQAVVALPSVSIPKIATMTLKSDKTELKVGEVATFTISLSADSLIDGADAIISFDPKVLAVNKSSSTSATVKVGSLFDNYPANKIDEKNGRVELSGISYGSQGGKMADGILGTFTLKAKAKGVAKVNFEFSPGSTVDANVIETNTGKDILQKVEGVEVVVK